MNKCTTIPKYLKKNGKKKNLLLLTAILSSFTINYITGNRKVKYFITAHNLFQRHKHKNVQFIKWLVLYTDQLLIQMKNSGATKNFTDNEVTHKVLQIKLPPVYVHDYYFSFDSNPYFQINRLSSKQIFDQKNKNKNQAVLST